MLKLLVGLWAMIPLAGCLQVATSGGNGKMISGASIPDSAVLDSTKFLHARKWPVYPVCTSPSSGPDTCPPIVHIIPETDSSDTSQFYSHYLVLPTWVIDSPDITPDHNIELRIRLDSIPTWTHYSTLWVAGNSGIFFSGSSYCLGTIPAGSQDCGTQAPDTSFFTGDSLHKNYQTWKRFVTVPSLPSYRYQVLIDIGD